MIPPERETEILRLFHAEHWKLGTIATQLGLVLGSVAGKASLDAMAEALDELPDVADQHALDELAAAYADVYLRHTYRAAPTESVWLTEDGLERQAPMFRCREFYRRHELRVTDWANRTDDHLVVGEDGMAFSLPAGRDRIERSTLPR